MPRWFQEPMPFLVPELPWRATPVRDLPSWKDAGAVSVDIETCDPLLKTHGIGVRRGGNMAGISFSIEDGPSHYLPFAHEVGENLDKEHVLQYMRDQARDFTGVVVGANQGHDLDYLWESGVKFDAAKIHRDVLLADPLIDELQVGYDLDSVAKRWDVAGKDETLLYEVAAGYGIGRKDVKKNLWRLPPAAVAPYAIQDAVVCHHVRRKQERRIDEVGLQEVYDLESNLMPCLLRMRRRGIKVNLEKVQRISDWTLQVERECADEIYTRTGVQIGVGNAKNASVLEPVFTAIGITLPLTPKTRKPTINKGVFLQLKGHPVVEAVKRAREFSTLRTTFCKSVMKLHVNGRIYATFNQLRRSKEDSDPDEEREEEDDAGARYGRTSSTMPNFQQQPIRHKEYGKVWRSIYEADDGGKWICLDFGQQEPRWLTHYAEKAGLPGAKEAADRYRNDPSTDNHAMMAAITGLERSPAKIIFLGLCYGEGGAKLCHDLGLPTKIWIAPDGKRKEVAGDEGQRIINQFNDRAPYVKLLAQMADRVARERGMVRAGMRHCHFPRDAHGNYEWTYKALNRIVQGEAANQCKVAIVVAYQMGYELQATIHDELDYTEHDLSLARARKLKKAMEECYPCNVPALCDMEVGDNFGEIEKVAA